MSQEREFSLVCDALLQGRTAPPFSVANKYIYIFSQNASRRIADVQDFVARCQRSCPPFVLTTSVPFRELNDKELSLGEADLANAVIVQRPLDTPAPFGHS